MKMFPIQDSVIKEIPWALIESHETQALKNHSQTIKRLAERQGTCPLETVAILQDKNFRDRWPSLIHSRESREICNHEAREIILLMVRDFLAKRSIPVREFVSPPYSMFSGQGDAVAHVYNKHVGKSGRTWLVANHESAAENVYVTNNVENTRGKGSFQGFGGATLTFKLVDGSSFDLHGGWHSNSDALFDDTGVDVRDKYYTFVVLSKELRFTGPPKYERILRDVIYQDEKPILGTYNRYKDLIKQYPEAKYYYMESKGGSSSGPV